MRVVFSDRWAGSVTGFEVDESWEVLNILVTDGIFRPTTVKLPLDQATWTADRVAFPEATSAQAFRREIPPVGAPARPVTTKTPTSLPGTRVSGALIDSTSRRAGALLVTRGNHEYKAPIEQAAFSGKEIVIAVPGEALDRFFEDAVIEESVRQAIVASRTITQDEKATLEVAVRSGRVLIGGNVHTSQDVDALRALAAGGQGAHEIAIEAVDDVSLEFEIARALYRSGVGRSARIHPRSTLGEVTLFGYADGANAAAEAVRAASQVAGVRSVEDRIEVGAPATATA
jgi:osmotically-inducible protein OsmY